MELPCVNCITLAICNSIVTSGEIYPYTEREHTILFFIRLVRKCYILRVWLKSDPKNVKDSLVRYKEFIKFYNINKPYGSSVKPHYLKNLLKNELKRRVVIKVLKGGI